MKRIDFLLLGLGFIVTTAIIFRFPGVIEFKFGGDGGQLKIDGRQQQETSILLPPAQSSPNQIDKNANASIGKRPGQRHSASQP